MAVVTFTCEHCGQEVSRRRSPQHRPPKFCSQKCNGAARSASSVGPTLNVSAVCEECGRAFQAYRPPSAVPVRFCSIQCMGSAQRGAANPAFSGGRHQIANGYVVVLMPDHPEADVRGYVYEHRLVAERSAGRPLLPGEVVHHINHVKADNRPENLHLCADQAEHARIHAEDRRKVS